MGIIYLKAEIRRGVTIGEKVPQNQNETGINGATVLSWSTRWWEGSTGCPDRTRKGRGRHLAINRGKATVSGKRLANVGPKHWKKNPARRELHGAIMKQNAPPNEGGCTS